MAHATNIYHTGLSNVSGKAIHPTDLTRSGACSLELGKYCPTVASGAGLLAQCLLEHVEAATNRGVPLEMAITCSEELQRFRGHAVDVGGLRALPRLRKACDAETKAASGLCGREMERSTNTSVPVLDW